ncbi:MAG: response regulator [Spirochaetales bacterium]|nr:response regulator [Spirochaetales bacterium]
MSMKAVVATLNPLVKRILAVVCEKHGIQLVITESNPDLIEEVKAGDTNIIFIDESFDRENNYRIIDEIKSCDLPEDPLLIFIKSQTSAVETAELNGIDYILPIPFSNVKFEFIIRNLSGKPRKILLAGEMTDNIMSLYVALKKEGYELYHTPDATKCMDLAYEIFPDLILVRYSPENRHCLDFCGNIKKDIYTSRIQIVFLSETDDAAIIEKCFEAGANDTFLPPFKSELHLSKVKQLVSLQKRGKKSRAIVIDDSAMIRNLISRMFKQIGFSVAMAENGKQGIEMALRNKPDIITCDYDMPIMNGWEFCTEAKKIPDIMEIPIVMVTARGADVDKKKGAVLGVADYLTKPFREDDLKKCVSRVLDAVKKQKEREAITKYVASDVISSVDDMLDGVKKREAEDKFITILFSDICSFTPKCEKMGPRAIVSLLNSYFDRMIMILKDHEAIIDKLIGDAIVVRFDSGDRKRDAKNAVLSAYDMLNALVDFNKTAEETIEVRIGINSGNVILGNLGCESFRLDYTMIGDNVNITQRLESQSPHMGCLISDSTYELVREDVEVGPGQAFSLKGKTHKVIAYPLLRVIRR